MVPQSPYNSVQHVPENKDGYLHRNVNYLTKL